MDNTSNVSYAAAAAAAAEVGWFILGENQENVGPYALSELQGDSFGRTAAFVLGAIRVTVDWLKFRDLGKAIIKRKRKGLGIN